MTMSISSFNLRGLKALAGAAVLLAAATLPQPAKADFLDGALGGALGGALLGGILFNDDGAVLDGAIAGGVIGGVAGAARSGAFDQRPNPHARQQIRTRQDNVRRAKRRPESSIEAQIARRDRAREAAKQPLTR